MHESLMEAPGGKQRPMRQDLCSGPISILPQTFEPLIADALDAVPVDRLPKLRFVGTLKSLRRDVEAGLADCGFGPAWLAEWLTDNVLFQARLYGELTRAPLLKLRLESVEDDNCSRFHADNVSYRLIATYRGSGTEWIDPKISAQLQPGKTLPNAAIRRLKRGWVAFIRGAKEANLERPALLHRSPPIAGTGEARLLLAIDDASD